MQNLSFVQRLRLPAFRLAVFGFIAIYLIANLSVAKAAPEYNIKMSARSLFEGAYKYGDWLPVEITLENFGAATTVQVETTITNVYNNVTYPVIFRRTLSLGERSNKKFHFYIQPFVANSNVSRFVSSDQTILLKTSEGERKLAEQNVRLLPVSPKDYLVATLNSDPNLLTGLNSLKVGKLSSRVSTTIIGPADFPDRVEGWRSFNALVLSEVSTSSLSQDQITALRDWVSDGGQLILMGGNGWGKVSNGFDKSFLPVDVYDYQKIDNLNDVLSGEAAKYPLNQPVTIAVGEVLQGAKPLAITTIQGERRGPTDIPLIAERRVGQGRVVSLAMDIASSLLSDWGGSNLVWQDLFSFNSGVYYQVYDEANPHLKNNAEFFPFVANVPDVPLPDITPFLGLFALYLVVISPLNYLVLKRFKRPQLAWVTIPLIGVAFLGSSIWLARTQPPGNVLVNQMSVVQVSPGQEMAQTRSYVAIFSPQDKLYNISPNVADNITPPLILPLNRSYSSSSIQAENERTILSGDQPRIESFRVGQWSAQGLSMEGQLPSKPYQLQSNLSTVLVDNEPRIRGSITNSTGQPVRGIMLALGDQVQKIKDLEVGETVNVDFVLPPRTVLVMAYCNLGYGTYNTYNAASIGEKLQGVLQTDRANDKVYQNRGNFLRKIFEIGRYSVSDSQRGLDLMGWLDNNPMPISIDGVTTLQRSQQLLLARLPVSVDSSNNDGRFYIPSSYMHPENEVSDSNISVPTSRLERSDQICLSKGAVTVEYRLPTLTTNLKANRMVLYINSLSANSSRSPVAPAAIEAFDWKQGSWVKLDGIRNSAVTSPGTSSLFISTPLANEIDNPTRFLHPQTGLIDLRFTSPSTGALLQFGLEVEGARG